MMLHRFWEGPPNPSSAWQHTLLSELNPFDEVVDWSPTTLPTGLQDLLGHCSDMVRPEDEVRHRANIIRLWLLNEFGGWWVDHDLIPLRPFDSLPFPATAAHGRTRCSCWLAFPAGHPLLWQALNSATNAPRSSTASSIEVSGEHLITRLTDGRFKHVPGIQLPIDGHGHPIEGAEPWAVHLYNHRNGERR